MRFAHPDDPRKRLGVPGGHPRCRQRSLVWTSDASATESQPQRRTAAQCDVLKPPVSSISASGSPAASKSSLSEDGEPQPWCLTIEYVGYGQVIDARERHVRDAGRSICWPCSSRRTRCRPDRLSAGGRRTAERGPRALQRLRIVDDALKRWISALAERRSTRRSENRTGVHVEQIRTNRGMRSPRGEDHSSAAGSSVSGWRA